MDIQNRMSAQLGIIARILTYFFAFTIIYLMWLLKSLLIPFVLAIFFALLLLPMTRWLISRKIPKLLATVFSATLLFLAIFLVIFTIGASAGRLVNNYAVLEAGIDAQIDDILLSIRESLNIDLERTHIIENMFGGDFLGFLFKSTTDFAGKLTNFGASFVIMMIYLFAILAGLTNYEKYFEYLENGRDRRGEDDSHHVLLNAFEEIHGSLFTYMKIKFIASFATGLGYGLIAYFFGLKFYLLIGFIAFALNFIPTIGSIIATIPPALLGLFFLDSAVPYFIMLGLMLGVQMTVGNIIEPRFQGENLGINFMTVILGLVFFGFLWGVIGMLLSVPMLVLARVVLKTTKGADWIVRLMAPYHEVQEETS